MTRCWNAPRTSRHTSKRASRRNRDRASCRVHGTGIAGRPDGAQRPMRDDLMVNTRIGPPPATALQLLLAAERLFAEHGLAGVSLRQISLEAGSSNNSAIRYHFGSKEDLLRAIFTYRLGDLTQRRALLRARANPNELRSQLEAHVLPLIELAESPDSSYVSFIEQLQRAGAVDVFMHQSDAIKSQADFI